MMVVMGSDLMKHEAHNEHYKAMPIEPIAVIRSTLTPEEYKGFLLGNWLKYKLRAGHKGDAQTDLDKAEWYIGALREERENRNDLSQQSQV